DGQRGMARKIYGHDINHILLLHLGAFSSTILPQVFDMLKQKGLPLITLEEAAGDPAYQIDADVPTEPSGDSLLEQMMILKKLPTLRFTPKPYKELASLCQ